jgi:YVTN family beta-propeller protein
MWVIDTQTNQVVATIPTPTNSWGVAITPDGSRAYVTDGLNSFLVIDTKTNKLLEAVSTEGEELWRLAISPDGSRAYIAAINSVLVVNTCTNKTITEIPVSNVGAAVAGLAFTPDGTRAYVSSGNTNTVSVIDTATNSVVGSVTSSITPNAVAISASAR